MNTTFRLVENQIAMSKLKERLEHPARLPGQYVTDYGITFGPCLFLSRECGAGASVLAERIGYRLGWNVFDSKIVNEIAEAAHVHQTLVESVDEHVQSYWERTWHKMMLGDFVDHKYLRYLSQTVTVLAHLGRVVLVGRGAQFFLPSQCGLRVRLCAPLAVRAKRVAERTNLTLEKALLEIEKIDTARDTFIWQNFHQDISSFDNYDLILNTGEINLESTTRIVLATIQEKLGVGPKTPPTSARPAVFPNSAADIRG